MLLHHNATLRRGYWFAYYRSKVDPKNNRLVFGMDGRFAKTNHVLGLNNSHLKVFEEENYLVTSIVIILVV